MSKNMYPLITNNIIVIFVHMCICHLFYIPIIFMWELWSGDITNSGLMNILFGLLMVGTYTAIILYLYFWAGKKFLKNTHHLLTNIFSVIVPAIIILALLVYKGTWIFLFLIPFTPLGEIISSFFQIGEPYSLIPYFFLVVFLPSLTMLAGMMAKQWKCRLPW